MSHTPLSLLTLSAFVISFLGSWHCAAMCGGLVASLAPTPKANFFYQIGRLFGYLSLGFLAGQLGEWLLTSPVTQLVSWMATGLFSFVLLVAGVRSWVGKPQLFLKQMFGVHQVLTQQLVGWTASLGVRNLFWGAASVLLPCGWLYSFILAAVATRHTFQGMLLLFAFWMGNLPVLVISPMLFQHLLAPFVRRTPKLVGMLLIGLGFLTLYFKVSPMLSVKSPQQEGGRQLLCPIVH